MRNDYHRSFGRSRCPGAKCCPGAWRDALYRQREHGGCIRSLYGICVQHAKQFSRAQTADSNRQHRIDVCTTLSLADCESISQPPLRYALLSHFLFADRALRPLEHTQNPPCDALVECFSCLCFRSSFPGCQNDGLACYRSVDPIQGRLAQCGAKPSRTDGMNRYSIKYRSPFDDCRGGLAIRIVRLSTVRPAAISPEDPL